VQKVRPAVSKRDVRPDHVVPPQSRKRSLEKFFHFDAEWLNVVAIVSRGKDKAALFAKEASAKKERDRRPYCFLLSFP
jgi:hypothetical protein